jgi:hypothetical protein
LTRPQQVVNGPNDQLVEANVGNRPAISALIVQGGRKRTHFWSKPNRDFITAELTLADSTVCTALLSGAGADHVDNGGVV